MQESDRPLLVIGHKNPDTDSVCAAVAYARLKNDHLGEPAVPCRAGNLNRQTSFVLSHFGVESPRLLTDVHPTVADIMVRGSTLLVLQDTDPLERARREILAHRFSFLPVVDGAGTFVGRVTALRLAGVLADLMRLDEGRDVTVKVQELETALGGRLLAPISGDPVIRGRLSVSEKSGALRILPLDRRLLAEALRGGARLVVGCGAGVPEADLVASARAAGCGLLVTDLDPVNVAVRVFLLQPVGKFLDAEPHLFAEHDLVRDARREMAKSNEGGFVVVDAERKIRGVITRINLLERARFRLALVDHNELAQAVDGAEEAEIVEVIDHHRIGVRATDSPITFINRVVGSTCTIVADLYRTQGIHPEPAVAGIMLAAVLSDTLILRSPTTTPVDRTAAAWLAEIAGEEVDSFGERMFSAGSALEGLEPEALLAQDRKVYEESGLRFAVSQIEVVGLGLFDAAKADVASRLEGYRVSQGLDFACLMVTDLTHESSLLLCAGDDRILRAITYPRVGQGLYEMKGVLSRKKQVLPYLLELIRGLF
jgi:manganese-dependent inorganic pyrophosphatase